MKHGVSLPSPALSLRTSVCEPADASDHVTASESPAECDHMLQPYDSESPTDWHSIYVQPSPSGFVEEGNHSRDTRCMLRGTGLYLSAILLVIFTSLATMVAMRTSQLNQLMPMSMAAVTFDVPVPPPSPRTLVLYVWSNNKRGYLDNLRDFIARVVRHDSDCDYAFILNQSPDAPHWNLSESWPGADSYVDPSLLPALPPGSIYIDHPNECYDSGTWGWFLSLIDYDAVRRLNASEAVLTPPAHWNEAIHAGFSLRFPINSYKYFVLMNASVRGPFFPSYIDLDARDKTTGRHIWPAWYYPFVHLMEQDPDVKLAGSLTSCERRAHVQSYFLLTDQIGLGILRAGPALQCHTTYREAIDHGEFGLSSSILNAGYNIAGLLSHRQGVEFRGVDVAGRVLPAPLSGNSSAYCDASPSPPDRRANPTRVPHEGVPLNQFDVLFLKWPRREEDDAFVKQEQWQRDIAQRLAERKRRQSITSHTPTPTQPGQSDVSVQ